MRNEEGQPSEGGTSQPSVVMVECPHCGRCFIGADLLDTPCPRCGEEWGEVCCLRARPCIEEPLVEVYRTSNWIEAEIIRERLSADGIVAAFARNAGCAPIYVPLDGVGQTSLMALESEAARARRLVEEYLAQISAGDG